MVVLLGAAEAHIGQARCHVLGDLHYRIVEDVAGNPLSIQ